MTLKLIVICAFFYTVVATGTYYLGGNTNPDYPNKCWNEGKKVAYSPKESVTVDCVKYVCTYADEHGYSYEMNDCSHPGSMASCRLEKGNNKLDYPACCPQWKC